MKNIKLIKYMDKPLLILMILYSCIGLLTILSASNVAAVLRYGVGPYYFFIKQLMFIGISFFVGFLFIIRVDISKYKNLVIFIALVDMYFMLFKIILVYYLSWDEFGLLVDLLFLIIDSFQSLKQTFF